MIKTITCLSLLVAIFSLCFALWNLVRFRRLFGEIEQMELERKARLQESWNRSIASSKRTQQALRTQMEESTDGGGGGNPAG